MSYSCVKSCDKPVNRTFSELESRMNFFTLCLKWCFPKENFNTTFDPDDIICITSVKIFDLFTIPRTKKTKKSFSFEEVHKSINFSKNIYIVKIITVSPEF